MVKILSVEEAEQYRSQKTKEIGNWFTSLSFKEREMIFDHYKLIFVQMKCKHEFFEIPYYGTTLIQCKHCSYFEEIS
jgi:hypothetical protein